MQGQRSEGRRKEKEGQTDEDERGGRESGKKDSWSWNKKGF